MSAATASPGYAIPVGVEHRFSAVAVVLSFAAGATDAFAFLLLGGIFTANMTGNLVLAGLVERAGYPMVVVGASVAIVAFAVGVYGAIRIAKPSAVPSSRLVVVLAITSALQAAVLVGWLVSPHPLPVMMQVAMIALSALAMAGQTGVARRIEPRSGVTTTFVTGTLTNLMADFADRKPQAAGVRVSVILALVAGALCGALLVGVHPALGAALPLVPSLAGLAILAMAVASAHRKGG
ncbi:DUF1275 domain-containing protein [Agromyces protaetiae]|uniref:DUF1275 domain-containing protein n=1 Tax=Agromyces protaetiae TaxID=2509455 RepID=A0A4P6FB46_9MICO|nr:YoaK family protein [Agromyces protaetiae]QAY73064.1 DUF1275 domain-containing protein [Agromyces protaetiae]